MSNATRGIVPATCSGCTLRNLSRSMRLTTRLSLTALGIGFLVALSACGKSEPGGRPGAPGNATATENRSEDRAGGEQAAAPVNPKDLKRREIEALVARIDTGDEATRGQGLSRLGQLLPESLPQLKILLARSNLDVSLGAARLLLREPASQEEAVTRLRALLADAGPRMKDVVAALQDSKTDAMSCRAELGKALENSPDALAGAMTDCLDWALPALAEIVVTGPNSTSVKAAGFLRNVADRTTVQVWDRLLAAMGGTNEELSRGASALKGLLEGSGETIRGRMHENLRDFCLKSPQGEAQAQASGILQESVRRNPKEISILMSLIANPEYGDANANVLSTNLALSGSVATEAVPAFRKLVLSENEKLVRRAILFFSSTTPANCVTALSELTMRLEKIPEPDPLWWPHFGSIMKTCGAPAAKAIALRLPQENRKSVRAGFFGWLTEIAAADPEVPRLVAPFLRIPETRTNAIMVLRHYGPLSADAVPSLIAELEAGASDAAPPVLETLACIGVQDPKDAERLSRWLKSNPTLAPAAMEAFVCSRDVGVPLALENLKSTNSEFQLQAILCLGELGGPKAIEALKALAGNPKHVHQIRAVRALIRTGTKEPAGIAGFEAALKSDNDRVVQEALRGLARSGTAAKGALSAIRTACKHKSLVIRTRALAALVATEEDPGAAKRLVDEWAKDPAASYAVLPALGEVPAPNQEIAAALRPLASVMGQEITALWLLPRYEKDRKKLFDDLAPFWKNHATQATMACGFLLAGYEPAAMIEVVGIPDTTHRARTDIDDIQRDLDILDALAGILEQSPRATQYVRAFLDDKEPEIRLHATAILQRAHAK